MDYHNLPESIDDFVDNVVPKIVLLTLIHCHHNKQFSQS